MEKRSMVLTIFDGVLLFVFIYSLVFNGINFASSKLVLFYLFLVVDKKELMNQFFGNRFLKSGLLIWILFSVYFFGVTIFSGKYHFGFLQQTFWFFWEGIFGAFLFGFYLIKRYPVKNILYLISVVLVMQSIFVLISFLSGTFRDIVETVLLIQERHVSSVRLKGFSNTGGAGLSYLQSLCILILGYLYLSKFRNGKSNKTIIIAIIIVFISQIFIARTGMIFSGLFIGALILQNAINKKSLKPLILQSLGVLLFSILAYNFYAVVIPKEKLMVLNEKILSRAFESIDNYNKTGSFETRSTTVLNNMYFFPKTETGLIFGEGVWDSVENKKDTVGRIVNSDVGYVRIVFAAGLIGSIMFYFLYYLYSKGLFKTDLGKIYKLGIFVLLIVFIMGELKEPFLVRPSGIIKVLCLLLFVFDPFKKVVARI
ncbi:hypothetical protein [Pedobacter sp. B4-66]|uniref:hypothetical protein n=1 Tax=Pedobacter sp. B4-66 TaxID=2817280 RepID=UPI001BDA1272|nr:hypothetical protein [Pedobacter sp. B4-66]